MLKTMTPAEYAKLRGVTPDAIIKAIDKQREMPNVVEVRKFGRFFLLTVEVNKDGRLQTLKSKVSKKV